MASNLSADLNGYRSGLTNIRLHEIECWLRGMNFSDNLSPWRVWRETKWGTYEVQGLGGGLLSVGRHCHHQAPPPILRKLSLTCIIHGVTYEYCSVTVRALPRDHPRHAWTGRTLSGKGGLRVARRTRTAKRENVPHAWRGIEIRTSRPSLGDPQIRENNLERAKAMRKRENGQEGWNDKARVRES